MRVLRACCFALLLLTAPAGYAQPALSPEAQVSLITILPGTPVYTTFGHSAIRVYDPALGIDQTYNYGTFDFGNPVTFVGKFAYGKLDYFLSVNGPYRRVVEYYWTVEERPLIEQVLNLSIGQRNAVYRFLEWNRQPENAYYRYDFFFDNCSTRIRDVFEEVLGDSLQFAPLPDPDVSLRRLLDPYVVDQPFLDVAMDLGLGLPADHIATPHEAMFLPDYLMRAFDHATVTFGGWTHPLVARTDTVTWSEDRAEEEAAWPWPSILAWTVCVVGLHLTGRDLRTGRAGDRHFDGLLYGVTGVVGLVIMFLWFVSLHAVTQANLNLLWAWPTHLVAAVAVRRAGSRRWLSLYLLATALVGTVLLIGWPFWPQELPASIFPIALLLSVRSVALAYLQRGS